MNTVEDDTEPWNSIEKIERYQSLFPVLPNFVAHHTIGGSRLPRIGLPDKHALDLAEDILSVAIARRLRISIPWAKKRYSNTLTDFRWLGLTERIDTLFDQGRRCFDSYVSFGLEFKKEEKSFQDLSMQFFFRNMAAFDAAKRLSELGYLCEVATILRMAIEQFAFAGRLWALPASTDLKRIKAINSIQYLKEYVPSSSRLYGLLSKYVHFEYDHHTHFFQKSSKQIYTVQWDSVLRAYATHLIFMTMLCISRYVLKISKIQFGEIPAPVAELNFFNDTVKKYSDDVCQILSHDLILADFDILLVSLSR